MKERFASIGTAVCLMVLTGLLLVFALAIFPGTDATRWFFATSAVVISRLDAPAWVQAIAASIAIIAGAAGLYWQAGHQHRTNTARIEAEEVRRLHILWSALVDMRARLRASSWHELGPFQTDWDRVDEAVQLLREIPLFDVPDWRVAFSTRQAVDTYAVLRRAVPHPGNGLPPRQWWDTVYGLIDASAAHCLKAQKQIEQGILSRRGTVPIITIEFVGGSISSNED
jgi:hypothetical protein